MNIPEELQQYDNMTAEKLSAMTPGERADFYMQVYRLAVSGLFLLPDIGPKEEHALSDTEYWLVSAAFRAFHTAADAAAGLVSLSD